MADRCSWTLQSGLTRNLRPCCTVAADNDLVQMAFEVPHQKPIFAAVHSLIDDHPSLTFAEGVSPAKNLKSWSASLKSHFMSYRVFTNVHRQLFVQRLHVIAKDGVTLRRAQWRRVSWRVAGQSLSYFLQDKRFAIWNYMQNPCLCWTLSKFAQDSCEPIVVLCDTVLCGCLGLYLGIMASLLALHSL